MFVGITALEGAFAREKGKTFAERDDLYRISVTRLLLILTCSSKTYEDQDEGG